MSTEDSTPTTTEPDDQSAPFVDGPIIFPFPELPEGYLDASTFESLELGFAADTNMRLYAEGDEAAGDEHGTAVEGTPLRVAQVEDMPLKLVQVGDEAVSMTRFSPAPVTEVRIREDVVTAFVSAESMNGNGDTLSFVAGKDQPILCVDTSEEGALRLYWSPAISIDNETELVTNLSLHKNEEDPEGQPHIHLQAYKVTSTYLHGRTRTIETCVKGDQQSMMVGDIITASL